MNSSVTHLEQYRTRRVNKNKTLALFKTTTIVNTGIVRVYICNSKYCLVKICNNKIYRIGPSLMQIPINNIPSNWKCVKVYKDLTVGNLTELYNSLFKHD